MTTPPFNSASRLLDIFSKLRLGLPSTPSLDVWADALGIKDQDEPSRQIRVMQAMIDIREEADLLRSLIINTPFTPEMTSPIFDMVIAMTNIYKLPATWNNGMSGITESAITGLKYLSVTLRAESAVMSTDEINSLESELIDLKQQVFSLSAPEYIKRTLIEVITTLLTALRSYQIIGIRAFERAVVELMREVTVNRDNFEQLQISEESRQLWARLAQIAVLVAGFTESVSTIGQLIEHTRKLLGG